MTTADFTHPPQHPVFSRSTKVGLVTGLLLFFIMLLLPAPAGMSAAAWSTATVATLMAIWWVSEALPIPITALLPLLFFPLLNVSTMRAAAAPYAHPLIFLFLGGFMLALAMERWQLHKRIALSIIAWVGTNPSAIIFGFMLACAFLSMWVSNTATAMMMLPIGLSIIELTQETSAAENAPQNFGPALMLAIAYACNIGGMGTLIGTAPNALMAAFMEQTFRYNIGFAQWMLLTVPLIIVALPLVFLILTRWVFPIKYYRFSTGDTAELIEQQKQQLGPITRPEKLVGMVFLTVVFLWLSRPLLSGVIPGVTDAGIAIFGALLLFVLPAKKGEFLLSWEWAHRLPWGTLLLFGGGLSLATAIKQSGLATWIGNLLSNVNQWPVFALILIIILMILFLTELTSNTATTAAFLPILASVAVGLSIDPLRFAIPATLAASCAFMLPVATPPNAIVFGSRLLSIPQMMRAGWRINLLFAILIFVLSYTLLPLIFPLNL